MYEGQQRVDRFNAELVLEIGVDEIEKRKSVVKHLHDVSTCSV